MATKKHEHAWELLFSTWADQVCFLRCRECGATTGRKQEIEAFIFSAMSDDEREAMFGART